MTTELFASKLTIRIYNTDLRGLLSNIYQNSKHAFENKNHFIVSLIRLGLETFLKELKNTNSSFKCTDLDRQVDELKILIDDFLKFYQKQVDISNAHFKVCEKLGASILNVMVALTNNGFVDQDDIETGRFEDLPNRLERIILEAKYK